MLTASYWAGVKPMFSCFLGIAVPPAHSEDRAKSGQFTQAHRGHGHGRIESSPARNPVPWAGRLVSPGRLPCTPSRTGLPQRRLADVRAHGVRQPILVDLDKGAVVDGWHRYRMAALAGRECPAIDVASWPAAEVEAAVQSSNRHRRHSSRKELLGVMARQRLTGESAPSQTVEQEARFAGVTKRRYQQVLQATREDLGLAPPNSGGRPPAAAVQEDAEALDLDRVLELQAETIEAQQRAAAGLASQVLAAGRPAVGRVPPALAWGG